MAYFFPTVTHVEQNVIVINVKKKLFSLEHSVRALNHTSKTALIILARTLRRTHWLPLHTWVMLPHFNCLDPSLLLG